MAIMPCESLPASIGGRVAGFISGHVAKASLSPLLVPRTGVTIGLFNFSLIELAVAPALTAYRTDIAKTLSATE